MEKKQEGKKEIIIGGIKALLFTLCSFLIIYVFSGFVSSNYESVNAFEQNEKLRNIQYDEMKKQIEMQENDLLSYNNKLVNDKFVLEEKQEEEKITIKDGEIINSPIDISENKKIAYLTFDDGPSQGTIKILDILKKENIKATFFVIGEVAKDNKDILIREKNEGHTIANHTYSHNYNYVYASTDNFISDLKKNELLFKSILGEYNSNIIRFPGGSFGKDNKFKESLTENNYRYVDWNCLNGDADAPLVSKDMLISNFKKNFCNQKSLIVLMHDMSGKSTTIDALPSIIDILKSNGYEFRPIK